MPRPSFPRRPRSRGAQAPAPRRARARLGARARTRGRAPSLGCVLGCGRGSAGAPSRTADARALRGDGGGHRGRAGTGPACARPRPGAVSPLRRHRLDAQVRARRHVDRVRAGRTQREDVEHEPRARAAGRPRQRQHEDAGTLAVVGNRCGMPSDRHRRAAHLHRAARGIAAEAGCARRFLGRARVAVVLEPARELEGRVRRRQRGEPPVRAAHRDELAVGAHQDVGARPPGRQRDAGRDRGETAQAQARAPEEQPETSSHHQREGGRGDRRDARHRAGQRCDPPRAPHHRLDAPPHYRQRQPLEPQRHQHQRGERRRHDEQVADRDRDEIGDDRELLALVEVVGGERRDRDARDERREHDAAQEKEKLDRAPRPPSRWRWRARSRTSS